MTEEEKNENNLSVLELSLSIKDIDKYLEKLKSSFRNTIGVEKYEALEKEAERRSLSKTHAERMDNLSYLTQDLEYEHLNNNDQSK